MLSRTDPTKGEAPATGHCKGFDFKTHKTN